MTKMLSEEAGVTASIVDPTKLLDASRRSANLMTAATELLSKTTADIVSKQTDLFRIEGSEIAKSAAALARGDNPAQAAQDYVAALRGGAEGAIADWRAIQDLMRGCAWSLFGLYVDAASVGFGNGRLSER